MQVIPRIQQQQPDGASDQTLHPGAQELDFCRLLTSQKLLQEYLGSKRNRDYLTLHSRKSISGHLQESKSAFIVIDAEGKIMLRFIKEIVLNNHEAKAELNVSLKFRV